MPACAPAWRSISASTNGAEVGELAPPDWPDYSGAPNVDPGFVFAVRDITSLFGTPEGLVIARLPVSVMDAPRGVFQFRVLVTSSLAALGIIVIAALLIWLIP